MALKKTEEVSASLWDEVEVPVPPRAPAGKMQACVDIIKRLIDAGADAFRPKTKKRSEVCSEKVSLDDGRFPEKASYSIEGMMNLLERAKQMKFRRCRIRPDRLQDSSEDGFLGGGRDEECSRKKQLRKRNSRLRDLPAEMLETPKPAPPNLHAPVLSFSARLLTYVNEKYDGLAPMAYKRAGISRQIYSRIVSRDDSTVNKRTAMQFCIGLQLNMQESELLLKSAGYAFSGTLPEDRIFMWCIENRIWNIDDINEIFRMCSLRPIPAPKSSRK